MSERYFDRENNKLSPQQEDFLKEKVEDLRFRIKEDTDLELESDDIVYYSAGFYDEYEKKQDKPYNIELLAAMIMSKIPKQKRLVQEVEEKDEVRKERELLLEKKESSFFDNIINLADAITDAIPVVVATIYYFLYQNISHSQQNRIYLAQLKYDLYPQ